ncbi:hypothetical protein BJX63DRAFT_438812 [Aspergillus granulosus]|uniref:Uncharacterized protein n=1 Tax=Aspergillus granulosus TaxID=176169 RepID=A0ABR4GR05_9EURO
MSISQVRDKVVQWMNGITYEGIPEPVHEDDTSTITSISSVESGQERNEESSFIPLMMGLTANAMTSNGVVIARNSNHKIMIKEVQEHLLIPEYPATSADGILHFIHEPNPYPSSKQPDLLPEAEVSQIFNRLMSKIQFATQRRGRPRLVKMDILQKTDDNNKHKAWHRSYICGSVKWCSQHASWLEGPNKEFDHVNLQVLNNKRRILHGRGFFIESINQLLKKETEDLYQAFLRCWEKAGGPCEYNGIKTCEDVVPVMFCRNQNSFLGCPKNSDLEPWHYAYAVHRFAQIDQSYLKVLIEHGMGEKAVECDYIAQPTSRKPFCGMHLLDLY